MANRFALSALASGMALSALSVNAAETLVVVRATQQNMPTLVKTIADLGESTPVALKPGNSLEAVIRNHCGSLDPTYLTIAIARNKVLEGWEPGRKYVSELGLELPACARSPESGTVTVPQFSSVSQIALDNNVPFSFAGPDTAPQTKPTSGFIFPTDPENSAGVELSFPSPISNTQIAAAFSQGSLGFPEAPGPEKLPIVLNSPGIKIAGWKSLSLESSDWRDVVKQYYGMTNTAEILKANSLSSLDRVAAGDPLTLPGLQPVKSTFPLRPGVDAADAVAKIKAAIEADTASVDDTVAAVSPALLVAPLVDASCKTPATGRPWPFDETAVLRQLGINTLAVTEQPSPQTVLILDTGFDFYDSAPRQFPSRYLRKLAPLPGPIGGDESRRLPGSTVEGINLASRSNDSSTIDSYADRWHGLAVAGTAMGTREMETLRLFSDIPVRLAFANITKPKKGGVLIEPTSLEAAMNVARKNGIGVINASFLVPGRIPGMDTALATHGRDMVLVVAAGNDGAKVSKQDAWPAMYGGRPENGGDGIVIVVGAHDRDGRISGFSRWDEDRVDILAPGCEIPSYAGIPESGAGSRIGNAEWAGTSFSAPLVSFTAAILHAYRLTPGEIKARLVLSSDVSNDLDTKVYSRGRLNIEKALAWPLDQFVVEENGAPVRILSDKPVANVLVTICGKEMRLRSLGKLARFREADGREKWHLWRQPADRNKPQNLIREGLCDLRDGDTFEMPVTDLLSDRTYAVSLKNLIDFVPALNR